MEAIRSSETSGTTQRTTRRHIPEEDTLQNHRCENLKSYRFEVLKALTMRTKISWDYTPCSVVDFYQSLKGTYCLYVNSRVQFTSWGLLAWLALWSWRWKQNFILKYRKFLPNYMTSHPRRQYYSNYEYFSPTFNKNLNCYVDDIGKCRHILFWLFSNTECFLLFNAIVLSDNTYGFPLVLSIY
jgi:hypothetical protein